MYVLLSRTIIASNNGVKSTRSYLFPKKLMYWNFPLIFLRFDKYCMRRTFVRDSSDFRLKTLPVSKNIGYLLILL